MNRWIRHLLVSVLLAFAAVSGALALTVPSGFTVENMVPATTFTVPTALVFLPDGRYMVAEKSGRVRMVVNNVVRANAVINLSTEVLDLNDRGLLDVAVDPAYFSNHYIYLLYTVDPDTNGVDTDTPSFGRLVRYTMNTSGDTNVVNTATRTVLMGTNWPNGPLIANGSHTIGSLRWGRDGSLLVSIGEGANFQYADNGGLYPSAFGAGKTDPNEDIGAYRSQDITSLAGKILRINPANGHGYASNPFVDGNLMSVRSRVYAYGVRNPFRMTLRPNTGSPDTTVGNPGVIMFGDVGWDTYEEMNRLASPGLNFGWPCREGMQPQAIYPLVQPSHNGCSSLNTPTNPATAYTNPLASWHHSTQSLSSPPNFIGNASVGGVFYSDTLYPSTYRTRYFFADYAAQWIKVANLDANNSLLGITDFGTAMDMPVCVVQHPTDGCLWYVSISTGQIRRIRWTGGSGGGNQSPIAAATASPTAGLVPLNVTFSSAGTYDPEGQALTYSWNFGDGGTSNQANPLHTYQIAGSYTATLTVTDTEGGSAFVSVPIAVGAVSTFPTTGVLDNFNRANGGLGALWVDDAASLSIVSNTMRQIGLSSSTVWNGATFGPDQECYLTLQAVTSNATELDLMLKVQGTSWSSGHIEVRYEPTLSKVTISTYHPTQGWVTRGVLNNVSFGAGDRFGARALSGGTVEVFKSGISQGSVSVSGWPYVANGGRLGLTLTGNSSSIFDDFGGGNWSPVDIAPTVNVTSPDGGEAWTGGSSHAVTWTATDDVGVTGVDVYYRDTASAAWIPLGLDLPNSGSFTWFVHNTPGTSARVKVRAKDTAGQYGADSSAANFTIVRTPGGIAPTTLRDFKLPGSQPLSAGTFANSSNCTSCHGGYDANVEPGHGFKGTMMAHAARDPIFYACLAIAEQDAPSSGDLCIRCHAPMAWLEGRSQPTSGANIDAAHRDGVSCDFCHRMVDPIYQGGVSPVEDLALLSAMYPAHVPTTRGTGQYVVDANLRRRGPFADPVTPHSFLQSPFHTKSEICATCHDVSNPVFDRVAGARYAPGPFDTPPDSMHSNVLMPLERTYSEWLHSAFPAGVYAPEFAGNAPGGIVSQCQDCHMRPVTGKGANAPDTPTRTNLPLHDMTGGNAWMGGVIASLYPGETEPAAIAAGAARATGMLQGAATLKATVTAAGDSFRAEVRVTNHTGHKLPTGYPEGRRMWISVTARDANGAVVYQSAPYDTATGVLGLDAAARVYEMHLGISSALAGVLGLAAGPSFHFTLNDSVYKDNRIPPTGFTNSAYDAFGGKPVDHTLPEPRYADGQNWDVASYALPATARAVSATLWYQTTSKDYIEFLRDQNTTNSAGQAMHTAWAANRRSPPVLMARDSIVFDVLDSPRPGVPRTASLRAIANPFRGSLQVALALPVAQDVTLEIFDVSGRLVTRMPRGRLAAGEHRLFWNGHDSAGSDVGAGVFWAVVPTHRTRLVQRIVRLR